MNPPRHIYSSTLSRRDRVWGRPRRRPSGAILPLLTRLTAVTLLVMTVALVALPRLPV